MENFKLNYESRNKLRNEVYAYLSNETNQKKLRGKKCKLPKEALEALLFEEVVINPSRGIIVKLPFFSGSFLRFLDLSEVSFEDVSWGLLSNYDSDFFGVLKKMLALGVTDEAKGQIDKIRKDLHGGKVEYLGTNAVIDLSKSFEAKHGKCINISCCCFDGENIAPNSFNNASKMNITRSEITGHMRIPENIELTAVRSDLKSLDLSSRKIDGYDFIHEDHRALGWCDLRNTGISIELVPGKFHQMYKDEESAKELRKGLKQAYEVYWQGCFCNGKRVSTYDERSARKSDINRAYRTYEQERINDVLDVIKETAKNKRQ